jgi:hypothetical protein
VSDAVHPTPSGSGDFFDRDGLGHQAVPLRHDTCGQRYVQRRPIAGIDFAGASFFLDFAGASDVQQFV